MRGRLFRHDLLAEKEPGRKIDTMIQEVCVATSLGFHSQGVPFSLMNCMNPMNRSTKQRIREIFFSVTR